MSRWIVRVDSALDAGVLAFALWTLCSHAAVALGFGLDALMGLAAATGIAALALTRWLHARPSAPHVRPPVTPGITPGEAQARDLEASPPRWARAGVVTGAVLCAIGVVQGAPLTVVWALAAGVLVFALVRESALPGDESTTPEAAGPRVSFVLAILAVVCVFVALAAHRPDADDSFYLNLAVAAVDDPTAPLLAGDTLHRVPDVPLALPIYRVHSLELFEASLARLTGQPVIDVAHLWLPGLLAFFVPFVYARLMRRLTPRAWPWSVSIAIGVLLFTAVASHGWANFGLLRLHQGKGMLLTLVIPALITSALGFARDGGASAWLRLAAAQICAVGLSASGLWIAPLVAGPALLAGSRSLRSAVSWRRIGIGLTASTYVVVLAFVVRAETIAAFRDAAVPSPEMALSSLRLATQALRAVMGPGLAGAGALFVAIAAWSFARGPIARRLCLFTTAATLVLWNPFFGDWIAAQLTSAATYWRVFWLLPMPALVAVVLSYPIEHAVAERRVSRLAVAVLSALVFGGLVASTPRAFAISAANHVRLGKPSWKVPENDFDAARAIVEVSDRDDRVLAPRLVAPWIPTFHQHPVPLVVRAEYLPVLHERLGPEELQRRMILLRLVSGQRRAPQAVAILRSAIASDKLSVIALANSTGRWPDVEALLRETGFQKIYGNADYEVWRREPATSMDPSHTPRS